MKKVFTTEIAGRTLQAEIGQLAQLANGACLVRYGDTTVLSTATASKSPRQGIDFFPLSVDYEEKMYAVGKFPGGFLKREGRPTEQAILTSRAIDRPMRPLFPKDLRNDVNLNNLVLSVDPNCSPAFCAMFGSSLATVISDIPWNGPTASVNLGLVDGELVINPTQDEAAVSDMDITMAGTADKICMIEAGANEVPDEDMLEYLSRGFEVIQKLCQFINEIAAEVGKPKFAYESSAVPDDVQTIVRDFAGDKVRAGIFEADKETRDKNMDAVKAELVAYLSENYPDYVSYAGDSFDKLEKEIVRLALFHDHKRVDGRAINQIRDLSGEVGVVPRMHGSSLFQRGSTQVLNIVTLAPMSKVQKLDGLDDVEYKRYMHHYNFPGYSVGEAKPNRSPGRREIGHGALAERSLLAVLPSEEEFPYAIRSVSEVLMSNGSTSQGSVCSSCMALMDAGVPITRPVAGISSGLIVNPEDESDYLVFMDIQGIEDFYGDMDFKVAGTTEGITGIQVDIKVNGLSMDIIREAFAMTKAGRLQIINEVMIPTIAEPRAELSPFAPKILQTVIPVERIGEVIGKSGKVINQIIADTGAQIDIEDDGRVFISAQDIDAARRALAIVVGIVTDPEPGQVYEGRVTRLMNFGAFVEYLPGKEGLVHISKMAWGRVEKVEDAVAVGDIVTVKVLELDDQGRINLSIRDTIEKPEGYVEPQRQERPRDNGHGRDQNGRGDRGGYDRDRRPQRDNRDNRDNRDRGPSREGDSARPRTPRNRQD